MILAETSADAPVNFVWWIGGLFFFLLVLNEGRKAVVWMRGKPGKPPNELLASSHDDLKRRVDVVEDDVSDIKKKMIGAHWFHKIDTDLSNVQRENKDYRENKDREDSRHRKDVYEKMDSVRKEMKHDLTEQTKVLSQRIESMPSEIVTILKNTNAI